MRERYSLGSYEPVIKRAIGLAGEQLYAQRIWSKDASLWKREPEHAKIIRNALGWLNVAEEMLERCEPIRSFADSVRNQGLVSACLLGMGGSSLCPEVCAETFGSTPGYLTLKVLDTTDPDGIRSAGDSLDPVKTLFLVSSKSGGTIESACLQKYFFEKVRNAKGQKAGGNFVAITDPGTPLERLAHEQGFLRVFLNPPDIGGRYSALSYFGLVPMALMGMDVVEILRRALHMARRCQPSVPAHENPGLVLGTTLGTLARLGRDKLTLVMSPDIEALGSWLEQLLAESTGKEGYGIIPVDGERLGGPNVYGEDRVFVRLKLSGIRGDAVDEKIGQLSEAGHPVLEWELQDRLDLGSEFFRWEFATSVASAVLGINAFDQPNVKESKDNTQRLIEGYEAEGKFNETAPEVAEGAISLYAEGKALDRIKSSGARNLREGLGLFLKMWRPGDYLALLAYIQMTRTHRDLLDRIRRSVRDRLRIATTVGFGPRFLHSTGQLHKGGKNSGLFLQITHEDDVDLRIPGEKYSFAALKKAQALGDLEALAQHGRRALRIHIEGSLERSLNRIHQIVTESL